MCARVCVRVCADMRACAQVSEGERVRNCKREREYAREEPLCIMWFAWIGRNGAEDGASPRLALPHPLTLE